VYLSRWRERGTDLGRFLIGVRFKVEVLSGKMRGKRETQDHWDAVVMSGEDVSVELVKREKVYQSRSTLWISSRGWWRGVARRLYKIGKENRYQIVRSVVSWRLAA
jgi:hypothetical protein